MERFLNVLTGLSVVLIVVILRSLRREHIRVEYSVSWLAAALVLLLLSQWSWLRDNIGRLVGLDDPRLVVLNLVALVFLAVFYRFSIIISALKDANIALAQRVAILEYRIRSADEER